jgi:hypothetical protein
VDGGLNYKFWLDEDADDTLEGTDTVLYEWSDKNVYADNPVGKEHYCVEVRCASDPDCNATTCLDAGYEAAGPPLPGPISNVTYLDDQKTTMQWNVEVSSAAYDIARGDIKLLRDNAGDFSASSPSCLENNSADNQTTDTDEPVGSGEGYYYLVRGTNATGNGTWGSTEADTGLGTTCE